MMSENKQKDLIINNWNEIAKDILGLAKKDAKNYKGDVDVIDYRNRGEGDIKELGELLELAKKDRDKAIERIDDTIMEIEENSLDWFFEVEQSYISNFFDEYQEEICNIIEKHTGIPVDLDGGEIQELIEDIDPDFFHELQSIYDIIFNWNLKDLYDYPVLVFLKNYNDDEDCDVYGDYASYEEREKQMKEIVKKLEDRYRIKILRDVWEEVLINTYFCSKVYLGAIINGEELFELLEGKIKEIEPEHLILLSYNGLEGSGDYEYIAKSNWGGYGESKYGSMRWKPTVIVTLNSIKELDYGSYSIGDIFGTSDWTY